MPKFYLNVKGSTLAAAPCRFGHLLTFFESRWGAGALVRSTVLLLELLNGDLDNQGVRAHLAARGHIQVSFASRLLCTA